MDGETGEFLWSQHYTGTADYNESAFAIACDADGNAFVTGRNHSVTGLDQIFTMKLSFLDGEVIWEREIGGSDNQDDRGWAVEVGADGHPVITGVMTHPDGSADFYTAKLDSNDGSILWSRTLPGAVGNLAERAGWIAVCGNGDVVMANRTWDLATSYDVVLHRYAGADGETVWSRQYGSGASRSDNPRHMVLDPIDGILVSGVVAGDFMAVRFDAETGEPVWNTAYDGPGHGYDTGNSGAIGPNGEAIVTGFATGTSTGWDCATAAFDWESGDLLWSDCYDTGLAQTEEGTTLTVGRSGTLYVVGYGYSLETYTDLLSIRYQIAPAAGAEDPIRDARLLAATPNPFQSRIDLRFDVLAAGPARVIVHDAAGRRIRTLLDAEIALGAFSIPWDGRDELGREATAGVYWVRLETSGAREARKILRLP